MSSTTGTYQGVDASVISGKKGSWPPLINSKMKLIPLGGMRCLVEAFSLLLYGNATSILFICVYIFRNFYSREVSIWFFNWPLVLVVTPHISPFTLSSHPS